MQPGERSRIEPFAPRVEARLIGELQIVQHHAAQPAGVCGPQQIGPQRHGRPNRTVRIEARPAGKFEQRRVCRAGQRCRPVFRQRLRQPREGGQWRGIVTGPCAQHQHIGARVEQFGEQAALADPRVAGHDEGLTGQPGVARCQRFGLAPDHSGRLEHRDRQGLPAGPGGRFCLLDGLQQRQGLGRRAGADVVLQHLFAAVEGEQGRGAITPQVVQAHDPPMGLLGGRITGQQLLCHGERLAKFLGALEPCRNTGERLDVLGPVALACTGEPCRKTARVGLGDCVQQFRRTRAGRCEIDLHMGRQARHRSAFEQVEAERLAQAKQALAQVGPGALAVHVRPQQHRQRPARRRSFDGQIGQHQRVLVLQHQHLAGAVDADRLADQAQSGERGGGGGGHGKSCRNGRQPAACDLQHRPPAGLWIRVSRL